MNSKQAFIFECVVSLDVTIEIFGKKVNRHYNININVNINIFMLIFAKSARDVNFKHVYS